MYKNPVLPNMILLSFVWGAFCIKRSYGTNYDSKKSENQEVKDVSFLEGPLLKSNLIRENLFFLKNTNLGMYRLLIVLSVFVPVVVSIIFALVEWPFLIVLPIPIWIAFWGIAFVIIWIYKGFIKVK